MAINDEEKRQIMNELAQGKPGLVNQELPKQSAQNDENFDAKNYQNFDDFAQRSSVDGQQFGKSSPLNPLDAATLNRIKEQITTELEEAKATGQLRAGRIREIVQSAVFQMTSEFKAGSNDIRSIVKDAVSAVNESLKERGGEIKEEITATIEGVIEGVSSWRRQSINKTQAEVKQLQTKLDTQEDELQQEITRLLSDIEEDVKDTPPKLKSAIESAIKGLKNSEEVALLQKRYAQLQAQAAILKANLAARYGGRYEEVKEYLDDAKSWYSRTHTKTEAAVEQAEQKLEERLREAGANVTKEGGRRLRKLLSELMHAAAELLREKEPPAK
jgi:gas vesicle protein